MLYGCFFYSLSSFFRLKVAVFGHSCNSSDVQLYFFLCNCYHSLLITNVFAVIIWKEYTRKRNFVRFVLIGKRQWFVVLLCVFASHIMHK